MEPFATLDELTAGLEWDLDEGESRLATETLAEASDLIRAHGRNWTPENAPAFVKRLTLKATARFLRNPDAYTQSRAGDETLAWQELGADNVGVYLTRDELKLIKKLTRTASIVSVPLIAHGTVKRPDMGYVPVDNGKPFPYGPVSPSEEPALPEAHYGFPTDSIPSRAL